MRLQSGSRWRVPMQAPSRPDAPTYRRRIILARDRAGPAFLLAGPPFTASPPASSAFSSGHRPLAYSRPAAPGFRNRGFRNRGFRGFRNRFRNVLWGRHRSRYRSPRSRRHREARIRRVGLQIEQQSPLQLLANEDNVVARRRAPDLPASLQHLARIRDLVRHHMASSSAMNRRCSSRKSSHCW